MPNKFLNQVSKLINDDKGKALSLPITQPGNNGISRTYLGPGGAKTVAVGITDKDGYKHPAGFTPEQYYYTRGTQSISDDNGFPSEAGNVQSNVSLKNNTSINKVSRTDISWTPTNASPLDSTIKGNNILSFLTPLIPPGLYGPSGTSNTFGNAKITPGFTNPFLYITNPTSTKGVPGNPPTGLPDELGTYPNNIKPNFNKTNLVNTDPDKVLSGGDGVYGAKDIFDLFNNNSQYSFVHNLDKGIPVNGLIDPSNFKEVHLASYVSSSDNEDPTMFGYDIVINFASSPLFNGSIISFINSFGSNEEIESRRDVWLAFCKQFFKFFKVDQNQRVSEYSSDKFSKNTSNAQRSQDISNQTGDKTARRNGGGYSKVDATLPDVTVTSSSNVGKSSAKTYYLKKISGLENLVEREVSSNSDTIKSMVDYGKDIIKLSLNEDVSVNTGYLAMLYKSLSWSRLNGKQIIPENLLRFDAKITITEIRDYNKVIKDFHNDELKVYPDLLTKYAYTLYDCQFMFNEMSHGSEIDMSSPRVTDDFSISFNYKYSTLSFDKFYISGTTQSIGSKFSLNNRNKDILKIYSVDGEGVSTVDGEIRNIKNPIVLNNYKTYSVSNTEIVDTSTVNDNTLAKINDDYKNKLAGQDGAKWDKFVRSEPKPFNLAKTNSVNKTILNSLGNKLKKAAVDEVNRQITTQFRLLNRTLDNIRNSIGLGRMSEPTNVYNSTQLGSDVKNAFRDFVGQSVRGFFQK